jgi:hypothetical protein
LNKEKNQSSFLDDFEKSDLRNKDLIDEEYQNIINSLLNLDEPRLVYENILKSKQLDDLPQRYRHFFGLVRKKILDFLKIGDFGDGNVDKLRWLMRFLYLLKPLALMVNPVAAVDKIVNFVFGSKIGRSFISIGLEISKTEKETSAKKKMLNKQQIKYLTDFIAYKLKEGVTVLDIRNEYTDFKEYNILFINQEKEIYNKRGKKPK